MLWMKIGMGRHLVALPTHPVTPSRFWGPVHTAAWHILWSSKALKFLFLQTNRIVNALRQICICLDYTHSSWGSGASGPDSNVPLLHHAQCTHLQRLLDFVGRHTFLCWFRDTPWMMGHTTQNGFSHFDKIIKFLRVLQLCSKYLVYFFKNLC